MSDFSNKIMCDIDGLSASFHCSVSGIKLSCIYGKKPVCLQDSRQKYCAGFVYDRNAKAVQLILLLHLQEI